MPAEPPVPAADLPASRLSASSLPPAASALLEAVLSISADLDLPSMLERIVQSAVDLTGARYGALGVLGGARPDDGLTEFVTIGLTPEEVAEIGDLPRGRGILGHVIRHPVPLRLPDLSQHHDSVGFPPGHPPMVTFLGVPVRIRGVVFGNLYLTEKTGGVPFDADDETLVTALADVAGFVIDHARAYAQSEQRRRWLEASARITATVDADSTTHADAQEIAGAARAGARARAALFRADGDASATMVAAPEADRDWVARLLAAVPESGDGEISEHLVEGHLVVVLRLRPHLAEGGHLVVVDPQHEPGDLEWRDLLLSFADQAALTLDRRQALADRAAFAVVADRERIARDLHDLVIQRLFATGLQLQGTALAAPPEVAERLEAAVDALDRTIRDIRGTIFELRRSPGRSVHADIRALVRELEPTLGVTPELVISGPVDTVVDPDTGDAVLAVLREALTNVARHAAAPRVRVEVIADAERFELVVSDEGVGMPAGDTRESGLANARRRAESLGGGCRIGGGESGGTVFQWWIRP